MGPQVTRKLTIRTKLAATLAVPLVALAAFAALQVRSAYDTADQVKSQAGVATSATGPGGVVYALIVERDYETLRVLGLEQDATYLGVKSPSQVEKSTDATIGGFRTLLGSLGANVAGSYTPALKTASVALNEPTNQPAIRDSMEQLGSHAGTSNAKAVAVQYARYSALIDGLLNADEQSAARINDAQLRSGAELLNALNRQYDLESRMVIETVLASISQNPAIVADVQQLAGQQASGENDLRVRATDAFDAAITPALSSASRVAALKKLDAAAANPLHAKVATVLALPPDLQILRTGALFNVESIVSQRSAHLTSAAQSAEQDWIAVTIASILLAIIMLWLTSRWITRPLRALADQAVTMAGESLPGAVKEILDTPLGEEVQPPDVAPVRVKAGGEVHDVEVALNQVQDSALALALEQARLRGHVADAFVNLGRRNQNLLSRQLEFITQLENDESDPETLEHLFRLDHLATRMRRNAESLLVLAGHEPPRTWSAPVDIGDIVRGALGEVEGYQRVRIRHLDDARVDGAAAVDVSHVVAELVENALAFSPPQSDVEVYGRRDDHGYVLTVVDTGIGMPAEDLERANALLDSRDARTFAPSRFLGHYVVAQLAARHNLSVHLSASPSGGLTATIVLRGPVIGMADVDAPVESDADSDSESDADAPRPVVALPRRTPVADAEPAAAPTPGATPAVTPVAAVPAPPAPAPDVAPAPIPVPLLAQLQPMLAPVPPLEPEAEPEPELTPEPAPTGWGREAGRAEPAASAPPVAAAPEHEPLVAREPASQPWAPLALVPTPQASAPEPEPEPAPEPEAAPDPVAEVVPPPPARPRLGVGTFADLRAAQTPTPRVAPAPEAEPERRAAPAAQAPPPLPAAPTRVAPIPDRAAAFAEVAHAVDTVTGAPAPDADGAHSTSNLSEDLLPQRLPKRGRRSSRLSTPWARDKKAAPTLSAPPSRLAPLPDAPPPPAASMPMPPSSGAATPGAMHFPPGGPAFAAATGAAEPVPAPNGATPSDGNGTALANANTQANSEGDERFAFFAAFREASERAREEAGIDDRRGSQ
jgi:signal transduction histidine kinase